MLADQDIVRLPGPLSPLQKWIAWFISKRRAPKSRTSYESIGVGSPILKYSKQPAELISKLIYERYGLKVNTDIGMQYWCQFTEVPLAQIRIDKIDAVVIVLLYPQVSTSTSGSSLRLFQEEFSKNSERCNRMIDTVVSSW